jgi:hypothetical protein
MHAPPTTTINSNGSKWYGQEPDTIEKLIEVLGKYALNRTFERYGNFIQRNQRLASGSRLEGTVFFGNFLELSHVFNIHTTDPDVIRRLTKAIRANQRTPAYTQQPKPERRTVTTN